jgi:hypothetical protein
MTVSRISSGLLLVLLGLLLAVGPARAQEDAATGPPVKLFDEEQGDGSSDVSGGDPAAPLEVEVTPAPAPVAIEPPPAANALAETGIVVDTLNRIDPGSIGLLATSEGGFGLDMWQGSSRAVVATLVSRLPMGTSSRVMQDLSRRLLLSEARVPLGEDDAIDLLWRRVERLAAGGQIDAISELLRIAPADAVEARLARIEVDALYLSGDYAGACARADGMVGGSDDPYWLKAVAFCRALRGEEAKAMLAVGLLHEFGAAGDPSFYRLFSILTGGQAEPIESLPEPTALHLAMMRAANLGIPPDALEGAPPAILRGIATAPSTPGPVRVTAATRAEAVGVLDARALGRIYASLIFEADERGAPEAMIDADGGPRTQALLYQLSQMKTVARARARALELGLVLGRAQHRYATAARVSLPAMLNLPPSLGRSALAPELVRALLTAGATTEAVAWFKVLAETDTVAADALRPLIHIAAKDVIAWEPAMIGRWWRAWVPATEPGRQALGGVLLTVLEALGDEVPAADWDALLTVGGVEIEAMPAAAVWRGLAQASADERTGATVALALIALGEEGPAGVHSAALGAVITALRRIGLESEARALALEAALAKGL